MLSVVSGIPPLLLVLVLAVNVSLIMSLITERTNRWFGQCYSLEESNSKLRYTAALNKGIGISIAFKVIALSGALYLVVAMFTVIFDAAQDAADSLASLAAQMKQIFMQPRMHVIGL